MLIKHSYPYLPKRASCENGPNKPTVRERGLLWGWLLTLAAQTKSSTPQTLLVSTKDNVGPQMQCVASLR